MKDQAKARARWRRWYHRHFGSGTGSGALGKPFLGVDGEGGGHDHLGRQNYLLMRASDNSSLYDDNRPLTTAACLDYILALPADHIAVGYYFGYDATQILRDLPAERLLNGQTGIFDPKERGPGHSPYTWWKDYAIQYVPRQYLRVARLDRNACKVVPNSSRTINEVGGFFQKSFIEALKDHKLGQEYLDFIGANKDDRENFIEITPEIDRYCALECDLLVQLMDELRRNCLGLDLVPQAWRGAGYLAAALHTKHKTPKRRELDRSMAFEAKAIRAYYGGRFEITRIGKIDGPIYEYDKNSAYPSAMLSLPCPIHTRWRRFTGERPTGSTAVAAVSFAHPETELGHFPRMGSLPVRRKGRLSWPLSGAGTYYSSELAIAEQAGCQIDTRAGYYAEQRCDCASHAWVNEVYEHRKALGKKTAGFPLKLGIAGLYGKYAQRQGSAPWRDYATAGMITAQVRADLMRAIIQAPDQIVYVATDAVFSLVPLDLDLGPGLGQWELKVRPDLFIVQPGIYWSSDSLDAPKTRGIPRGKIIEHRAEFEDAWGEWMLDPIGTGPAVTVPMRTFIGHRMALNWGRPEAAGSWAILGNGGRTISFDWTEKRAPGGTFLPGPCLQTDAKLGGALYESQPYDPRLLTDIEQQAMLEDALDDYSPWGNSGE